jgi:phosphoribosyl 1,2-cyclic phosphodiesterase/CheY-like chemotaxis protein
MVKVDQSLHFILVDDDHVSALIHQSLITDAGWTAEIIESSRDAFDRIESGTLNADVILCDMMMPEFDGLEFFKKLRELKNIKQPIFIIITGKVFEYDKRLALNAGVDGYLLKPVNQETFIEDITDIVSHTACIQFWGVRGTLPVPGENSIRYGGNTNCVTLLYGKKHLFIFDAGTGIKTFSDYLIQTKKLPINAKIFISHAHYDHINGFPFFAPLYIKGNVFDIYGPSHAGIGVEQLLSGQMDSIYFPITMQEFSAKLNFHDVAEGSFEMDDMKVEALFLNHPGRCLGYRLRYNNKSFCYITDNELFLEDSPYYNQFEVDRLVQFIENSDLLVIDTTYTDEEYVQKIGWGHSSISRVVDVADKAKIKLLCLYHHDPSQTDDDIDKKLAIARELLKTRQSKTRCIAPHEGEKIFL